MLEGPALFDPRLSPRLDRLLWLEAPPDVILRRVAGHHGRMLGRVALEAAHGRLERETEEAERWGGSRMADRRVDAGNPLCPRVLP